jgi:hypothetical protein
MGDKVDFSLFGPTGVGLHLTINPQKKPKVTTDATGQVNIPDNDGTVRNLYVEHGLTLNDKELTALKTSREQGIFEIDRMLSHLPGFADLGRDKRLTLAMRAADVLLEKSVQAKLSREVPTVLDEQEQADQRLKMIFDNLQGRSVKSGTPSSLLDSVPLGVSVTVHLPVNWL